MASFPKYIKIILVGLLLSLILSIIILSYVPPVSRDALIHHLAIPKLYLKHGSIYEIPELKFSYYPMNIDLLYLITLYFGNDIIPKLIHFSFALMTVWLIFGYLKKRIDTLYALFGVLLFLSLPVIIKLSITAYVDLGLVLFSTASIFGLLKWVEEDFDIKHLIYSAIWCGLALGTKYNGLIVLFLLSFFVPFIYLRFVHDKTKRQGMAIGYCAIFIFVSLMVFSPWMIKNYIWTNNPIYPLYDSLFNPKKVVPIPIKEHDADSSDRARNASEVVNKPKGHWGHFTVRKLVYGEKWWETALIPVRIFFQGKDDNPKLFDGRLNPYLFFLPFFSLFNFRKNSQSFRTEKKILFAFAFLFLFYAFVQTDMRIRYICPMISPLVILSVFGLHEIVAVINRRYSAKLRKILTGCVLSILVFLLSLNAIYVIDQFEKIEPMSYISGKVGRDEFIEKIRPEYAAISYANHNTPDNSKILCLFLGNRGYYIQREHVFSFDLVSKVVLRENSSEKIFAELESENITHILARYDLLNKWILDNYSDRETEIIGKFFKKHARLIYSNNGHGLYRLKNHVFEDG
ncbi:MAG: glycosyltransferase family 39 protein [Desulfobacteraceae bacterium]|nr:glycosyltransferase family 39 protein [Desulfobacteraceae bacterium]